MARDQRLCFETSASVLRGRTVRPPILLEATHSSATGQISGHAGQLHLPFQAHSRPPV